jgi:hypothetical protein
MPTIRQVLAAKIVVSLLAVIILIFLPLSVLPWLGLPEYDAPALMFIRLLGAAYAALIVVETLGCLDRSSLRGAIIAALCEMVGIALVLWHFVFYGYLATWPITGKISVMGGAALAIVFALLILLTGIKGLTASAEAANPVEKPPAP